MTESTRPIVIAGLPRSGTTWTLQTLGQSPGARRVLEADNEDSSPAAIHAKHRLGRYPVLGPDDRSEPYQRLWEWILQGGYEARRDYRARQVLGPGQKKRIFDGRRDPVTWLGATLARNPDPHRRPPDGVRPTRVVAKSIHLQLALEWLSSSFDVDVLVLLRHPANVLASWMEVNLKDSRNTTLESRPDIRQRYVDRWGVPLPGDDPVERMSWRIGLLTAALEEATARNPGWHVRVHEDLCVDSIERFRTLYDELDLEWTDQTALYLRQHDTPGQGFFVRRVASELSDSWQRRLDDGQLATLRRVLAWFPINHWSDADFERTAGNAVD